MPRIPHAAKTLTQQLQGRYKKVVATPVGDPDGLGVRRFVEYDKTSSNLLVKVLTGDTLDDPRIVGFDKADNGKVTVEFSHRPVADQRHPFPLDDAELVASQEDDE